MLWCAIDLETTGFDPIHDRIIEIGAVLFDEWGKTRDEFHSLCDPGIPIPSRATEVHGITDEMVFDRPETWLMVRQLFGWLHRQGDPVLVSHNAEFEDRFLQAALKRELANGFCGTVPWRPSIRWGCSLRLARRLLPSSLPSKKLADVCAHLGVELVEAHRAIGDARACAAIWSRMLKDERIQTVEDLVAFGALEMSAVVA